jgi:type IV pilus assembly protein PilW
MWSSSILDSNYLRRAYPAVQRGFSLIELLVGLLISVISTLVIFQIFAISEGQKRTTTSGADAQQTGSYAMYQLERLIRGAGSGLSQGETQSLWGCELTAFRSNNQILPAAAAFPAPFNNVDRRVRLVPVLIQPGAVNAPDVITVMYGRADTLNTPVPAKGTPTATSVTLSNTVGIRQDDLLLAFETGKPCTIAQATDAAQAPQAGTVVGVLPNPVNLGSGALYSSRGGFGVYSGSANILDLGNAVAGSRPGLQLFGIDTVANQLVAYDLLNFASTAPPRPVPIADNIVNLKALYGVDSNGGDNVLDAWVAPTNAFSPTSLTAGTPQAAFNLSRIKSIRLAIVARSMLREKEIVTPATLPPFFTDTQLPVTITLNEEDRHFRYYVFDVVIPLRNMLLAPGV